MNDRPHDDARSNSLHPRLTVALASTADRAQLAALLAGDLGDVTTTGRSPLLRSEDLWLAGGTIAEERAADRAALRSRLEAAAARAVHDCETATHQLESLSTWKQSLIDGSAWARQLHEALPEHFGAVEAARAALDERRHEQRTAQLGLERVLEQRAAAAAAIEEADGELAELGGMGMDETELRRELEAAGESVRNAERVHASAIAQLATAQAERTAIARALETLGVGAGADGSAVTSAMSAAVADALDAYRLGRSHGVDPQAAALAQAWQDLTDDIARLDRPLRDAPSADELAIARARVERAAQAARDLGATGEISPADRQAIDAAHAEVLEAEERIGRRLGAAAAKKRLEDARAAERALLEQHGFSAYIDVVLTGGRVSSNDARRAEVERETFEATTAYTALQHAASPSADVEYLRTEQGRLREAVVDMLGVDPGPNSIALLRSHFTAPRALQDELAQVLADAGVHPVGVSLEDAAEAFLDAHGRPSLNDLTVSADERLELGDRLAVATQAVVDAQTEVDRSEEALHLAHRSVVAFEGELSVRAGEDLARMKRFAAAEQLRAQVDAVQASLAGAEDVAREEIRQADQALAASEADFDRTASDVSELAREARKLAEELPIDQRPEGDPLTTLLLLAERLDEHALVLQPEIDRAQHEVDTAKASVEEATGAVRLATAGSDGPLTEDLVDGLDELLACALEDHLIVLDEPFVGVDEAARSQLLERMAAASADRQMVLLTEDAEVLGWAIELPAEAAAAVPADALLARLQRSNHDLPPAAPAAQRHIDITTEAGPAPSISVVDAPAPSAPTSSAPTGARRWAGQR